MQQALAETRKELELYPDETDRYESLVFIQTRLRDKPGVMATMQAWAKAAPDDPKPWGSLATALLSEKHYTEALEDAQHAVAHAPSGTEYGDRSRLLLGKVQLQLGKTAEADATLTDLLQTTTAPGMQNDAAYELANAGLELPLAEEKARAALGSLTAETKSWTGNESPTVLRQKSSLLAAAWDTLGWILFKEGKSKEAQTFIAASWTNRMHADVRDHLEKVQSALGPDFAQTPESIDLHREEQAVRTISLGPAGSRKGVAEYRLLLGANRVENAIPETEKTLPNADALLRSAHLTHLFPEDAAAAGAQLVHWAMLNCHGEVCELVFNP